MVNEEKLYGLGPGRLYIAPAEVSEKEACTLSYYAGPTKDGVKLAYSVKIHEIVDYYGALVRSLRYGERVRVEGRLTRLHPKVIARLLGSPEDAYAIRFGGTPARGKLTRVRVVLVCALPAEAGGGEMRFSMLATASSEAILALSGGRDSAIGFALTAETDDAGFSGRLVFG